MKFILFCATLDLSDNLTEVLITQKLEYCMFACIISLNTICNLHYIMIGVRAIVLAVH